MKNDVTSFHYYMWNSWNERECKIIFEDLEDHIWSIWLHSKYNIDRFYGMMDEECRDKLVSRALSKYDNNKQK